MNELHKKNPIINIVLTILIVATFVICYLFARDMGKLNEAYADIMQVEAISSTTQRQISLSENNEHQQREIFNITALTEKAFTINGDESISLMTNSTIALLATRVSEEWLKIEELLTVNWNLEDGQKSQGLDYVTLRLSRDAHFSAMTDLSDGIGDYTQELNAQISKHQIGIMSLLLFIGLIVFNNALQIRAELVISKDLAEKSQLDVATGLYNRSRCQELFKNNHSISRQRSPVFIVFDLNDLKKTNDNLGHRVGDELIGSFARILKKGCDVHSVPPFIGRYGGDEFVVYYDDLPDLREIEIYLKELEFLTTSQNDHENRFQVSYAVGYAVANKNSEENMTARQLFDEADAAMYINKQEGKRAKNPNYDEQKAKGEER